MNSNISDDVKPNDAKWPTASMLLWGTFGTKTPAARLFVFRSFIAVGLVLAWAALCFITGFRPKPTMFFVLVLLPGPALTYVALEWRRYLSTLDELARQVQLEAAAWTYVTGLILAMWLGGLAAVIPWPHYPKLLVPRVLVACAFFLFGLLEPIRSFYLYRLSRRY